jgi:hypothetical protein
MATKEWTDLQLKNAGVIPFSVPGIFNNCETRVNGEPTWYDLCFNTESFPFTTDTAIIVTSYHGQLRWLKKTLQSYRLTGKYVILAYDHPVYSFDKTTQTIDWMLRSFPKPEHYMLAHSVIMKHKTIDNNKRTGWFWDTYYARGIVSLFPNIKYVYVANGDCILEKPEGMNDLIALLGDADFMSGQSSEGRTIHSADMIFKVEAFNKLLDYMASRHKVAVWGSISVEALIDDALRKGVVKVKHAPKQPIDPTDGSVDYYCKYGGDSTFKDIIGFRNLYAEAEHRENNALEPLGKEYFDNFMDWIYMPPCFRGTICKYYDTGDRRYLYRFWDEGEDSWYNRIYYPVEHYGKEPIYAEKV